MRTEEVRDATSGRRLVPHKTPDACGRTTWVGLRALVRSRSSTAATVTVGAAVALIVVDGRAKRGWG